MKKFKRGDWCYYNGTTIEKLMNKPLLVVDVWKGRHEIYTVKYDKCYYNMMGDWLTPSAVKV
jgi:hypothetical protein